MTPELRHCKKSLESGVKGDLEELMKAFMQLWTNVDRCSGFLLFRYRHSTVTRLAPMRT
jgi:hypothetical protein